MFRTSESTDKITKSLVAAQADMPCVQFDSTNPYFHSRYASLAAIWTTIRPILSKHGLAVLQSPGRYVDGAIEVTTRLADKSGEWYEDTVQIPVEKPSAQGVGGAITYAKRYALSAMLGIVTDEDTDGNMPRTPPASKQTPPPPRQSTSAKPVTRY